MARMLKIASLPLAAVAAAALLLAPASATAKAKPRCSTAGTTLDATKDVRIYSRARSDGDPVYACAYKQGRKFEVGTFGECESGRYGDARFAGGFLAVRVTSCGAESESGTINVYDVLKRKLVRRGQSLDGTGSVSEIGSYVLAPNGAVAYITGNGAGGGNPPSSLEVRTVDMSGSLDAAAQTIDAGTDIVGDSLALDSQNTIYWRRGTAIKTASLGAP
jgi:hypothetical protein